MRFPEKFPGARVTGFRHPGIEDICIVLYLELAMFIPINLLLIML